MATAHQVQQLALPVLQATIGTTPVSWAQLMAAVQAANVLVKNWLHVRGALQQLLNAGTIARVQNVHVEQYYKVTK